MKGTEPRIPERHRFPWRMPLYAAASAVAVMLLLFVYGSGLGLFFIFFIVPIICLAFLALLVVVVVRRTGRMLSWLLAAVVFLVVSAAMLATRDVIRPSLRWLLWSRRIKAQVLARPAAADEEFKHVEWDGWGGTPVGDWTAYVVYDPTDSLLAATKDRRPAVYKRYKGIPCEVESVRRLESHWYSVVLQMNEEGDDCHKSPLPFGGRTAGPSHRRYATVRNDIDVGCADD